MGKSLTKNSLFYMLYNILNVIFPFFTGIYVARILLPDNIGIVETARNLAQYFVIFSFLGIPTYGLREISKARKNREELNKIYSELIVINTISTIIFLFLYNVLIMIVPEYRKNLLVFLITGISIALNFFNNTWLFEGLEKFDYISIRNLIFKFLSLLLLFIFVRDNEDYLKYALITIVGTAGNYLLNIINSKKYVKLNLHGLNLERHMKSVIYLVVVNLAIEIYSMVDITMLGVMCPKEIVTYYSYGMKIQKILLQIVNTFTIVLVPRISLYYKENRKDEFNRLLTKTLNVILIVSIPIVVGAFFLGNPLIVKLYGESYIRSGEVLKILTLAVCISPIGYLLGSRIMLVVGKENKMIYAVGMGAIVNLIGNFFTIPIFNEMGAAVSSILSEIVVAVIYIVISHDYFNLNKQKIKKTVIKIIIATFIMAMFLFWMRLFNNNSIVFILIQVVVAILLYFGVLFITKESIVIYYLNKLIN